MSEITLTEEAMRDVAMTMRRVYGEVADDDSIYYNLPVGEGETISDEQVERIWNLYNTATVRITFREDEHPAIESVLQYSGEFDGKPVIEILTTDKAGEMSDGNPDIRVYVNDGLVYGDDPVIDGRECEHKGCEEWCDHPSKGHYLNDGINTWVPNTEGN